MAKPKDAREPIIERSSDYYREEAERKAEVYLGLLHARARAEGRAEGLREMIVALANILALPLADERQRELAEADNARLEAIAKHLQDHRAWP